MSVLHSGSATDVGRVRTVNQDLPLERANLFAVADGMGGHAGGEVAARMAVETLARTFDRSPTPEGLHRAFHDANAAIWQESNANPDLRGMGTTLTAVAQVRGQGGRDTLALANVGDSRAYVYADGVLMQVTDDHSLAEERMRLGEMTEEEAAVHPQRHILTRALGVAGEVDVDMWELELRSGDRVLLCSDGLSNEVGLDEMTAVLGELADPETTARRLVEVANDHGGADNITVVVVDVQVGEDKDHGEVTVTPLVLGAVAAVAGTPPAGTASAGTREDAAQGSAPPDERGDPSSPTENRDPADTAVVRAVRLDDTLAPGATLGFAGPAPLPDVGPHSDEFFLGTQPAAPLSRSSTRVPPVSAPEKVPEDETRRERRRRLGVPRRVTLRVIGFVLLLAAVPVAAYFVLRWYAYDNWVVTVQGDRVVVKQGQPGGVLWFHPRIVDRTRYRTDQIVPTAVVPLEAGVQRSSLQDARHYITTITIPPSRSNPTPPTTATGGSTPTSGPAGVGVVTSTTAARSGAVAP